MPRPSSLIRLALVGGVLLLLRAIAREAAEARRAPTLLPPPAKPRPRRAAGSRLG
ncbi:hypothetical protein [Amaricoccus sp.]|uniref:hypothetical protein n=1 Tax=Amaricoccus sp. TaxID=1872485 RepID=UPI0026393849|nr:hypothetical protein [Amaricoccus sp.]HRO11006.1 hypothetical protein [Amaricoccus sp.]